MPSPTDIRRRLACAFLAAVVMVTSAASGAPPAADPPKAIDFADSLEMAQALIGDAPKPIVIQFGATWCGWCRKLESETLKDPLVLAMASKFAWVHADVDEQPELASRFGARALPHAVIVDGDGRVLAEAKGFSDPKGYVAFLVRGEAAYVPTRNEPIEPAQVPDRVKTLVITMAPATATGRQQCVDAMRRLGVASLPPLVAMLSEERLATRAAAAFALGELAESDVGFDPMGPAAEREQRVQRWRSWLESDSAKRLRPGTITPTRPTEGPDSTKPSNEPKTPERGPSAKPPGGKIA
jgi:thiol-disulfide isomerase/thioredoxin